MSIRTEVKIVIRSEDLKVKRFKRPLDTPKRMIERREREKERERERKVEGEV